MSPLQIPNQQHVAIGLNGNAALAFLKPPAESAHIVEPQTLRGSVLVVVDKKQLTLHAATFERMIFVTASHISSMPMFS
jgi:hypothetical protein